ncbi:hypothetical protein RhiirA4_421112 [Rhizophagus irregularis]|uniref:Uncharacterized protein n=1 Tax=Rhizophagus irregularis TaxID=588596 RepID=A0A2I1GKI1_9GLOM|nr:hypothetical protein RhiirA4_421112 [Rhizophagus irregularis]
MELRFCLRMFGNSRFCLGQKMCWNSAFFSLTKHFINVWSFSLTIFWISLDAFPPALILDWDSSFHKFREMGRGFEKTGSFVMVCDSTFRNGEIMGRKEFIYLFILWLVRRTTLIICKLF